MIWLLSLLGIGGIGGIALRLFAPTLFSKGADLLGKVPSWLIYAALGALAIGGALLWHGHAVKVARHEGVVAGRAEADAAWQGAFDKMHDAADLFRTAYERRSSQLADELRKSHDQKVLDNARLADALSLRGPGKAASRCGPGRDTGLSAPAGGHGQAPASPDAPRDPVPAEDGFAIVPWGWLVERAQERDDLLDEVLTWRDWYAAEQKAHDDAVARLKAMQPTFGKGGSQ